MALVLELKRRARDLVGPVLGLSALVYFVYHAVEGDRGLFAYFRLTHDIAETQAALDQVAAERQALEVRVSRLRPDSLDRDLLEERARAVLNYVRPDEVVVRPAAPQQR
jgi:cell division protein FtsB